MYTHLDCRLHLIINIQLTIKHILVYTYQKYGHQNVCIGIRNQEAVDLVGHGVSNVVDAVDYVPRKNMGVGMGPRHDRYKWG